MLGTNPALIAVELVAASIWIGGMVCIAIVFQVARNVLDESSQVALFRSVGRRHGVVGTASLLVAIAAGVGLSWPPSSWSGTAVIAFALAGALIVTTAAGMKQARSMSALRRTMVTSSPNASTADALRRGRRLANGLRGAMALMTLAIAILVSFAVAH
jgi:uncharacterized membrane protein